MLNQSRAGDVQGLSRKARADKKGAEEKTGMRIRGLSEEARGPIKTQT